MDVLSTRRIFLLEKQIQTQCDGQSAGHTPKEETSNKAINAVSKNVWIKLTGPAAESMAKAFSGAAVVAVQENKEATRGAEEGTAEEDSTAGVKAVSGPLVIAGAAGAGKRIRVLKNYRIVLLGKTKAGKSSLANTIFGEVVFKINDTLSCGTGECQSVSKSIEGRRITLIDTPGFFDFSTTEEELKREIVRCFSACTPGPHAFFIVLKVEKFNMERDVITKILKYFSEEALKYAAVVFTHGDQLPEGMKIEEFVDQNKCLSDLVKKCGGRCHVVDSECWNNNQHDEYRNNRFQVKQLLNTTDKVVMENKGGCYNNEMLQAVEREIEEEGDRTSGGNMTQGDTSSKAVNSVSKNVWIKLTGPAAKPLAEAFFRPAVVVLQETGEAVEGPGALDGGEDEAETEEETATETEEEAATEEDIEDEREEEEIDPAKEIVKKRGETEGTEKDTQAKAKQGEHAGGGGGLGEFLSGLFGGIFGAAAGAFAAAVGAASAFAAAVGGVVGGVASAFAAAAGAVVGGVASVFAAAVGAVVGGIASVAALVAAFIAGAGTVITAILLILGAIGVWVKFKIAAIKKWVQQKIDEMKDNIGIILLVVAFYSLLLLSFCAQVQIVGTPFFLFGALILLLLIVVLSLLL